MASHKPARIKGWSSTTSTLMGGGGVMPDSILRVPKVMLVKFKSLEIILFGRRQRGSGRRYRKKALRALPERVIRQGFSAP
jgi:hypothetical protein